MPRTSSSGTSSSSDDRKPLSASEQDELIQSCRAPALWAFAIAAGMMGFDAAVVACDTRDLPDNVVSKFAAMGYDTASLPPAKDVVALIRAYRLMRRPGAKMTDEARRAMDVADAYGFKLPRKK